MTVEILFKEICVSIVSIRYPLSNMLLGFTLWLSVMVTLERCLAFNSSQKAGHACHLLRFFCSQKDNATRMIVCVFACSFLFNALRFFEYQVNPNFIQGNRARSSSSSDSSCSASSSNSTAMDMRPIVHRQFMIGTLASAYFWLSAALHNIVPMITLISLTYVLARRIRRHDQLKARLANNVCSSAIANSSANTNTNPNTTAIVAKTGKNMNVSVSLTTADANSHTSALETSPTYTNADSSQFRMAQKEAYTPCVNYQKRNSRSAIRKTGTKNHASLARTITILVSHLSIMLSFRRNRNVQGCQKSS